MNTNTIAPPKPQYIILTNKGYKYVRRVPAKVQYLFNQKEIRYTLGQISKQEAEQVATQINTLLIDCVADVSADYYDKQHNRAKVAQCKENLVKLVRKVRPAQAKKELDPKYNIPPAIMDITQQIKRASINRSLKQRLIKDIINTTSKFQDTTPLLKDLSESYIAHLEEDHSYTHSNTSKAILTFIIKMLPDTTFASLDKEAVDYLFECYRREKQKDMSKPTNKHAVNKILTVIRAYYKFAILTNHIDKEQFDRINQIKPIRTRSTLKVSIANIDKRNMKHYTKAELEHLINVIMAEIQATEIKMRTKRAGYNTNINLKALLAVIVIALHTGARIGEIDAIERSKVFDDYIIMGWKSVAGYNRLVPIRKEIRPIIDYYLNKYTGARLLYTVGKGKNNRNQFSSEARHIKSLYDRLKYNHKFDHLSKDIDTVKKSLHGLRHTFITRLERLKEPRGCIADLVGHNRASSARDANITETYIANRSGQELIEWFNDVPLDLLDQPLLDRVHALFRV